jgi:hypothetical protein
MIKVSLFSKNVLRGFVLIISFVSLFGTNLRAETPPDEGMWLPIFVERLNYVDMQKMGLHLTAEEIYSINNSSLKDAIVGLGNGSQPGGFFCTAEVVSDQGLLFTNHHCGFDAIQKHSELGHDYLTDGFWAMSKEEELPNEDLSATFFKRMENVTDSIVPFLSDTMSASTRSAKVKEISGRLKKHADPDKKYFVNVTSFFNGNEYYLFVYEVFPDVRLVGAPPSAIGKFGGDTDNWMWPRHTGDFSILRVYSAADGTPAAYSKDNVPYKPKYHLPVSLNGYEKGDFTMVWGYPGSTDRYLCSYGVDFQLKYFDPNIVRLLGEQLSIWKEDMDANREVGIQYASKYASEANGWKYYLGEMKGLQKLNVKSQKEEIEVNFTKWVAGDKARTDKYGNVLKNLQTGYENIGSKFGPFILAALGANSPEILGFAQSFGQLEGLLESKDKTGAIAETVTELRASAAEHFKNYNAPTDQKVFARMMEIYSKEMPLEKQPQEFKDLVKKYKGDFKLMADEFYKTSIFSSLGKVNAFLDKPSYKVIAKDPAYTLSGELTGAMMAMSGDYRAANQEIAKNERLFMAGLREMQPDKTFYPDANSTMRFTYGTVEPYKGADAVYYDYVTHLSGVIAKEDPTNDEFIVPAKLKELYNKKDFGRYGSGDDLVTCFLTNNDITGGNSGSPVLNGNGELIGLAFDGNWESMSGNIAYEPNLQRCICVDIRYVLFIIDKYAGATNLIDELTFAPKKIKIPREVPPVEPIKTVGKK